MSKESEMKPIYQNILPHMPAPNATEKPPTVRQTCSYCGGYVEAEKLPPPFRVNGKRIPQAHRSCFDAANNPLFDMGEQHFRARPWYEK